MAQFKAIIQGNRGEVSRLGGKTTGIISNTNGWTCGVRVNAFHKDNQDHFEIVLTSGSDYSGKSKTIGIFTKDDLT